MQTVIENKKITLASFKSFVNKNKENLFILNKSNFDGMVDCVMPEKQAPRKVEFENDGIYYLKNNLGIKGVWLVLGGRDYFNQYEDELFKGIEVSNCCGNFILAIIK